MYYENTRGGFKNTDKTIHCHSRVFIGLIFHNSKANRFYYSVTAISGVASVLLLVYAYYVDFLHEGTLWLPVYMNTVHLFIALNTGHSIK